MLGMAVVLVGTTAITFSYAGDKTSAPPMMNQSEQFGQSNGENPIENFGGKSEQKGNNKSNNNTPPEFNAQGESQNDSQNGGQQNNQPPQMPDSNQDNQKSDENQNSDSNENAAPKGKNTSTDSNELSTANASMPMQMPSRGHRDIISVLCYVFGGLQLAIILMILLYLAFSEFNRLSFNQTLSKFRK